MSKGVIPLNEFTYRKRLTAAIVACVSVVIVCVGILSGGAYKQKTMRNSLESVQAQLEAAQAEELSLEERANILESQKNAAEDELSSIKVSTTAPVTETLVQTTASLTTASSTTASLTTAVIPPNKISPKPEPGNRKVYLTFDDGPSKNTPQILKILKKKKLRLRFLSRIIRPRIII